MPRITAAICTYDRSAQLDLAIASLQRQTLPTEAFTILVVDNSPAGGRTDDIRRRHAEIPNFVCISEPRIGLSNARNAALARSQSELVAFIDDDAQAHPLWLAALVEAFDALGADAGVVGGRVDLDWPAPRPPWLPDSHLGYLSAVDRGSIRRPLAPGEWLAGTNIAFRRAPLLAIGGFASGLGRQGAATVLLGNEEIEVSRRLADVGKSAHYEPAAVVLHRVQPERLSRSWFRRRIAWQCISDLIAEAIRAAPPAPDKQAAPGGRAEDAAGDTDDPTRFAEELFDLRRGLEQLMRDGARLPPSDGGHRRD